MRLQKILPLVFLVLSACSKPASEAGTAAPPKLIRLGVQPNERAKKNLSLFRDDLARRVALKVEIKTPSDYIATVGLLKNKELDFAFLSALTAIQAEREAESKILLKRVYGNSEFYYTAILLRRDSKIKSVSELKGKKFGFVDPKSTSGYLYPRLMLKNAGISLGDISSEFFGTHSAAVTALLEKKVDAVGVWSEDPDSGKGAWTQDMPEPVDPKRVKVLAISDPIPNDAFVVRETFYRDHPLLVFKVMEALIGMGDGKESVLKKVFDVDRMATATSRHYDSVRSLEELIKDDENKKEP